MPQSMCPRCCQEDSRLKRTTRCGIRIAEWLVPGTLLALMPKCPACVAAYFTLATGIGLSLTAATYVRAALIVVCVAVLCLIASSLARSFMLPREDNTQ